VHQGVDVSYDYLNTISVNVKCLIYNTPIPKKNNDNIGSSVHLV